MAWECGYRNIITYGPEQHEIADYIRATGYSALISHTIRGMTAVYESEFSLQSQIDTLAQEISRQFRCTCLLIDITQEWILCYYLFVDGTLIDTYDSFPSYGDDGPINPPWGGNCRTLCVAFASETAIQSVDNVLRRNITEFGGEINRLLALAHDLAIPAEFCRDNPGPGEADFLEVKANKRPVTEEDVPSPW